VSIPASLVRRGGWSHHPKETAVRYIIIVKGDATSESGAMPEESLMAAMAAYHEELARAGVLLDATGLHPSAKGWRVHYGTDGRRHVIDGPFAETKELVGGYTLIQVPTREAALEWSRRFPAPFGEGREAEIEVRQLIELDDLQTRDSIERFRALETKIA
jgi:hypothetical protein